MFKKRIINSRINVKNSLFPLWSFNLLQSGIKYTFWSCHGEFSTYNGFLYKVAFQYFPEPSSFKIELTFWAIAYIWAVEKICTRIIKVKHFNITLQFELISTLKHHYMIAIEALSGKRKDWRKALIEPFFAQVKKTNYEIIFAFFSSCIYLYH